ncbi:MAG: FkbM family methyltransferase [Chloroflexi bacterium]|nr:FkbM family methyltransferase [Chloroflexota bacterium]
MKSALRNLFDHKLPSVIRNFRYLRDYYFFSKAGVHDTSMGVRLWGAGHDTNKPISYDVMVFNSCMASCEVVVDIGANIGLFTCLAVQAGKQVMAIEPHPFNFMCLCKTLQINDYLDQGIEVLPIALSDHSGVSFLRGGGQGASLLANWGGVVATYETPVAINTLDNLLNHRYEDSPILIKCDVEGNEFNVLRGAVSTLQRTPAPIWIIEHGLTENFQSSINPHFVELFELFWQNGYNASSIGAEIRPVTLNDVERWISNKKRDFGTINYLFKRGD